MRPSLLFGAATLAGASQIQDADPIINLGCAGSYRGVIQNNGTVVSWKGIPYAQPPVGDLRFMPPRVLSPQNSSVVDVTTDALRCVQFSGADYGIINGNIVGSRAGPGQEDCLKLWIWKPANAPADAKLPVMFYIHGGALQYSAAPNNDFSDWVGQSQDFIAVNVGYRLGALGFMAHPDLPSANAGLLDQRMALRWIKKHIASFGGDPNDVTIMGQSGGGYAIISQMALYDGDSQGLFRKAIPRSIQRSPMFRIDELAERNTRYFEFLNCTAEQTQLDCFQNASVPDIVNAYNVLSRYRATEGAFQGLTFGQSGAFLPTIDGTTLTDSITRLFKQGKVAKVDVLTGAVNDEGANIGSRNIPVVTPAQSSIWNLTGDYLDQALEMYPVNATFGSSSPDNFFLTPFKAVMQGLGPFGEVGISGSDRLVGRYMADLVGPDRVWTFRFNAPGVGTNYSGSEYPLSYAAHSADNSYLQNATSVMTPFELALAKEWRAYIGSFIRTGNPNTEKLGLSPTWSSYGALGDYINSPVRLVPQFAFASNPNSSYETSTQLEVCQKAQIERQDWWTSDALLDATRV
ncbi:Alpha/Beta hydrolase protein [Stachybotrys elegans]|uniref:Carboxylic ester hydrolase n=1 Tax=Stachybotrys elegans TaxID=80388 RepID=A0A8K0WTL7_9HYPO|nr:Alpha/Beta hydrolase protein [Stachybotrys elegans]